MSIARLLSLGIAGLMLVAIVACGGQPASESDVAQGELEEGMEAPPPPPSAGSSRSGSQSGSGIPEERQAAPAPRKPSPPPTITVTVPAGTQMTLAFDQEVTSKTAVAGDNVTVRTQNPLIVADRVIFPAGSVVEGKVTGVKSADKGFKDTGGAISVSFDRIVSPDGRSAAIVAGFTMVAEGSGKKKAAIIGGSAAGGAVLGKVLDKDAGGAALIGGAIGTAIAGSTKGVEAKMEPGEVVQVALEEPLQVKIRR